MSSPYYDYPQNGFDSNSQEPTKIVDTFASSMRWEVVSSIVLGLVSTVAVVAIIYAIIDCLKKTGSAIPAYARIARDEIAGKSTKSEGPSPLSDEHVGIAVEPEFPLIRDSQVEFATMERFLSGMAREKPIRFSPQQIHGFTNGCSTILGSGAFGVVFKGNFPNGIPVAVKALSNHSNKKLEEQFMAEVGTMGRTYHANLVRLYGFCFDPSMVALVYEYMENGSLNTILFNETREIEWEKLHEIAIGTAKGLAYLHEECQQRIIHYDIKPENILLDENLNPKVADFGLAKLCDRERSEVTLSGGRGTLGYSAPEVWRRNYPITHKCDVYSFGILLFEMIARRRHFDENVRESFQWLPRWVWDMYRNRELPIMLSLCGVEEKDKEQAGRMSIVALLCIQHSPDARPLMSDVVKMLEGSMEIMREPENPFGYLESTRPNHAMETGSSGDMSSSISGTSGSQQSHSNHNLPGAVEIELACKY
ncbi:G-type lectin S-receptor serine/threonine-protein kinase [Salix suchowensis]|nr:G-type lectin S-receptor serine/threonine-protein kinase [Salix suchowensis]